MDQHDTDSRCLTEHAAQYPADWQRV